MSAANNSAIQNLLDKKQDLAQYVTDLHFKRHPELEEKYGEKGREKCYEDVVYHLDYLAESIRVDSKSLFTNYLDWTRTMLRERNIPENDLVDNMVFLKEAIQQNLSDEESQIFTSFIDSGLHSLEAKKSKEHTFLSDDQPLAKEARDYLSFLLNGKRKKAASHIDDLVANDVSIKDIYEYIFQATQYEVGILWQTNQITVAHEHYCTAATQLIMSQLYPQIFSTEKTGYGLVACSVADELHEIGIRMVADFFEMEGWDTYYMGANMPSEQLVSALKEYNADMLAISVTMPLHLGRTEELIKDIRADKEIENVKILVGGYPFQIEPELWKKIGADGSATSAKEAIKMAKNLID